jgi:hypothetical protein
VDIWTGFDNLFINIFCLYFTSHGGNFTTCLTTPFSQFCRGIFIRSEAFILYCSFRFTTVLLLVCSCLLS